MPPIGKLPQNKIDALAKWIEIGTSLSPRKTRLNQKLTTAMPVPPRLMKITKSHWAYKKPTLPIIPNLPNMHSPIDRFIHAKLAEQNLPANPPAEDHTLIRRMYYDLIGLPPTPKEVDAYVSKKEPN